MGSIGGRYLGLGRQWRWHVVAEQALVFLKGLGLLSLARFTTGGAGDWFASACART
jgi:hypothetical protein